LICVFTVKIETKIIKTIFDFVIRTVLRILGILKILKIIKIIKILRTFDLITDFVFPQTKNDLKINKIK